MKDKETLSRKQNQKCQVSKPRNVFFQPSPLLLSAILSFLWVADCFVFLSSPFEMRIFIWLCCCSVPFKLDIWKADDLSFGVPVTVTWKATSGYEGEDCTPLKILDFNLHAVNVRQCKVVFPGRNWLCSICKIRVCMDICVAKSAENVKIKSHILPLNLLPLIPPTLGYLLMLIEQRGKLSIAN